MALFATLAYYHGSGLGGFFRMFLHALIRRFAFHTGWALATLVPAVCVVIAFIVLWYCYYRRPRRSSTRK